MLDVKSQRKIAIDIRDTGHLHRYYKMLGLVCWETVIFKDNSNTSW